MAKQKIAILGGGIAALTTAFELTSQPGWEDQYEITLHQLGWRLGGKCATGRGPHGRIEEHGIHGFLGCYYNALPVMRRCYDALGRPPGAPLATFEDAFKPESFVLMWEFIGGAWKRWPFTAPTNGLSPADPASLQTVSDWIGALVNLVRRLLDDNIDRIVAGNGLEAELGRALLHELAAAAKLVLEAGAALLELLDRAWEWLAKHLGERFVENDDLRRVYIVTEFLFALVRGTIKDDIARRGFDAIDDENFSDWLRRHGASVMTVSSPLALNTVNLSYQYPNGDMTRVATMAAGCYLHWTLRSFAYMGAFAWMFEAGTGETVIAPLYLVLKQRGVKFEFFHKVENLGLSADTRSVETIRVGRQVALAGASYDPLVTVRGIPCWPSEPLYDQIEPKTAAELREGGVDLESYSSGWTNAEERTLVRGQDFDAVVLAIPPGAIPSLCSELLAANGAWRDMVANVGTVATQAMQLWLEPSLAELGWTLPSPVMDAYAEPQNTWADMSHLLVREAWGGAQRTPMNVAYFCGPLNDVAGETPERSLARVAETSTAWLRENVAFLWPRFDFAKVIESFFRANVEPSERYVLSKKGTTRYRLPPGGSGFANLYLAGDWTDSGFNAGCVEAAVISGLLAAKAITGWDVPIVPK